MHVCGTMESPKPGWNFYRSHGCQYGVVCPLEDDEPEPIQKSCVWVSNFDLACMEMRCRKPHALMPSVHQHRHARGTVRLPGQGWIDVAKYSGRYTDVQGAVYGKSCKAFVDTAARPERGRPITELSRMASRAGTAQRSESTSASTTFLPSNEVKVFLSWENDCCIYLEE